MSIFIIRGVYFSFFVVRNSFYDYLIFYVKSRSLADNNLSFILIFKRFDFKIEDFEMEL